MDILSSASSSNNTGTTVSWSSVPTVEFVVSVVSLLCFLGYFVVYLVEYRRHPKGVNLGRNIRSRRAWVRTIITTQSDLIVAVQTLRNSIMASTFVATLEYTVGFFVLGIAFEERDNLNYVRSDKLMALGFVLLLSFMNMSYTIRLYLHLGFLLGPRKIHPEVQRRINEYIAAGKQKADPETLSAIVTGKVVTYYSRPQPLSLQQSAAQQPAEAHDIEQPPMSQQRPQQEPSDHHAVSSSSSTASPSYGNDDIGTVGNGTAAGMGRQASTYHHHVSQTVDANTEMVTDHHHHHHLVHPADSAGVATMSHGEHRVDIDVETNEPTQHLLLDRGEDARSSSRNGSFLSRLLPKSRSRGATGMYELPLYQGRESEEGGAGRGDRFLSAEVAPKVPDSVLLDEFRFSNIATCERVITRATVHFFVGMRLLVFAILLAFWVVDHWALLLMSLFIFVAMYYTDHSVTNF